MALPSLDDLVTGLEHRLGVEEGSLEDTDRARAEAALEDASALVSQVGGTNATGGDADAPAVTLAVLYAAAKRTYLNPNGVESETVGAFSVKWGSVWLLDGERKLIAGLGGTGGLWTLGTTRGDSADMVYVDVVGMPEDPIPVYASDDYAVE
jgi:hypothetical protein